MKNFLRNIVVAGLVAASIIVVPHASALTLEEQEQIRTDPLGAVAWQGIKSSYGALTSDRGAYMAVSMYSLGDTRTTYPGALGTMDRCARSVTSSNPTGALRFIGAAACVLTNPQLKNAVSAQVTPTL